MKDLKPHTKLWLEKDEKAILGNGRAELLKFINKTHSLKLASKMAGISYKHAWSMIREMEKAFGKKIVESKRGGKNWGQTLLTDDGKELLKKYDEYSNLLGETIHDKTFWELIGLKISARNLLKGKIKDIEKGEVAAKVKIEIEKTTLTAVITRDAVESLDLKKDDSVIAIIKATEIMVGRGD